MFGFVDGHVEQHNYVDYLANIYGGTPPINQKN